MVLMVFQELVQFRVLQVVQVQTVLQVLKETMAHHVYQEQVDLQVQMVQQELKEQMVHLD